MRLLLFDIDGTLIRSNGAGRAAMVFALEQVFGTAGPVEQYRMGGKTDPHIITDLMVAAGKSLKEIEANLTAVYDLMAQKASAIFNESGISVCPGVDTLLAALDERPDVVLGLLTGNIAQTAPLKLVAAGIDPAQFRTGAYGSDAADRNKLPAIAMQRASHVTNCTFIGANTTIIGDTPADILCARAGKATAVAVASGWHSVSTLASHHPDYLLDSLVDTAAVLAALLDRHL